MDAREIEAALCGAGGPFEVATEEVLGERVGVLRHRASSLGALLGRSLSLGEREYLVFGDERVTYAEHGRRVASVAAALAGRYGVGKGDRVMILGANSPAWIISFWAVVSLGAVAVAANGWWTGPEIRNAIEDTEPKLLLGDDRRLDRLRGEPPAMPVLSLDRDWASLVAHAPGAPLPGPAVAEDDPALILFTSGTTGRAKGAVLSHRNLVGLVGLQSFHGARLMALAGAPPGFTPPQAVLLSGNPLFHVSGLCAGAIAHLASGAKGVWIVGKFEPQKALELIERERVTGWAPHGSMAFKVLNHPDLGRYDLSSVRMIGSGGAPVRREILEGLRKVFPGSRSFTGVGYGLTEASGLATLNFGEELVAHPGSVGRALPTVEVEIRDGEGRALPDGEEGEIALRGPLVMREYFRRPEATAASIRPGRWLHTGDLGRLEGGRLYVATRRQDLILRGAENVYPVEVEQRLLGHPAVLDAAVVGVASEELGQEVKAVVVLREGSAGEAELAAWVAEGLAYYKVPSRWELRERPLPRNASGKVMKHLLVSSDENPFVEE